MTTTTTTTATPSTVLITGCSSGFGLATALHFLTHGWNVIATLRTPRPDLFEEDEIAAAGDRLRQIALDITSPESITRALEAGIAAFGRIDVLVNNAGIGMFGPHEAISDTVVREVFETNTFGTMAMTRAILPHLRERGTGIIINVTSSVGIAPMPLVAAYTGSKHAVEGFSEALAYELGPFGIRVKIVQPGLAPTTAFAANAGERVDLQVPPAYAAFADAYLHTMQHYPAAYTTAEDVARAVYTAATDDTGMLRYPAGADSEMLSELRHTLSEHDFMARIREMFVKVAAA